VPADVQEVLSESHQSRWSYLTPAVSVNLFIFFRFVRIIVVNYGLPATFLPNSILPQYIYQESETAQFCEQLCICRASETVV